VRKLLQLPLVITDKFSSNSRAVISSAVTDRLSQATPSENYACLLDACIEAQVLYH